MWRYVVAVVLLFCLGLIATPAEALQTLPMSQPTGENFVYLPMIHLKSPRPGNLQYLPMIRLESPLLIEAVETRRGTVGGIPPYVFLYGYVRNLTNVPLTSVIVDLDVSFWPRDLTPPFSETVHIAPAFAATLPGQINPFSFTYGTMAADVQIGSISGVSSTPWVGGDIYYYPLTITGYTYEDPILSGTARNDSGQSLSQLRVVVAELEKCASQDAIVDSQDLLPGQETAFNLTYSSGCLGDDLVIVGQGAAQP